MQPSDENSTNIFIAHCLSFLPNHDFDLEKHFRYLPLNADYNSTNTSWFTPSLVQSAVMLVGFAQHSWLGVLWLAHRVYPLHQLGRGLCRGGKEQEESERSEVSDSRQSLRGSVHAIMILYTVSTILCVMHAYVCT